ncbi:copper resistance protein CopC [Alloacidobacterium dinghuense]|uniref:Copper resistance protein CopC n=1 Tax=Alloacidobacterium dinghuense TaxID=2763107 RepID=A0A7G8BJT0_9BACT|nr:copper resistance CopC family protein [Alloacidobacterium dinghuense]QNI32800.1 copper resistance protein CopC [Alloacidobacterium dinghuense]
MKAVHSFPKGLLLAVIFSAIVSVPRLALAHAVLLTSTPTAHATVKGPQISVYLKFNSRIDGAHSRLYLVDSSGKVQPLTLAPQDSPDALAAEGVKLNAGGYTIRWQALASDGHITRGEIPFTVQ